MNRLKTKKTAPRSSSPGEVRLYAPTSWHDLGQHELRYALTMMAEGLEGDALKTYMLIRFNKIKVVRRSTEGWKMVKDDKVFYADKRLLSSMIGALKFVDRYENFDARLDSVGGFRAVDGLLNGVPFNDYLKMEICYQMFSSTKEEAYLTGLARLLYRDKQGRPADGINPDKAERLGVLLWYAHVKDVFARLFPALFKKADGGEDGGAEVDLRQVTDAQLRLLTDGDVTKEKAVRMVDCKRALTELNAKAVEARRANEKLKSK